MVRIIRILAMSLTVMMLFSGCVVQPSGTNAPTASIMPTETAGQSGYTERYSPEKPVQVGESVLQAPSYRNYTLMWNKNGFNNQALKTSLIKTGYYGMKVEVPYCRISGFGALADAGSCEDSMADNEALWADELPGFTQGYSVIKDGEAHNYSGFTCLSGTSAYSRLLESGHYIQRMDMLLMNFKNLPGINGRVEIAAVADSFTIAFELHSAELIKEPVTLKYSLNLDERYKTVTKVKNDVITVADENGAGFSVFIPAQEGVRAEVSEGTIDFYRDSMTIRRGAFTGLRFAVIPSLKVGEQDAELYRTRTQVVCEAEQIYPNEGKSQKTEYMNDGYYSIDMNKMMRADQADFNNDKNMYAYDRLDLKLTNNSESPVLVPVRFEKEGSFGVHGLTAIIRDFDTKEPVGIPVQTTKNWHDGIITGVFGLSEYDAANSWEGMWYHGYAYIEVPAQKTVHYEVTIAYATWGGMYAASHSQLCLAGWGGNYQQWETTTLGCFGESFCYDMETSHQTSAFMNDVHAFLTYGADGTTTKYTWNLNGGGGGNFLQYHNAKGSRVNLSQFKCWFRVQGPNVTEVLYSGVTFDGAIKVNYRINLSRTDDAAKVLHSFSYEFLKDAKFTRLSFYAIGSDEYNSSYNKMVIGNTEGPAAFKLGDESFDGFIDINYEDYAYINTKNEMQRAEIDGEGFFAYFYDGKADSNGKEACARLLNVLSYKAVLNGKEYTQPAFNIRNADASYAGGIRCATVELCPQKETGNEIKAGSKVEGTVEFVPLPTNKDGGKLSYFGENAAMLALSSEDFASYKLGMLFVKGDRTNAEATVGQVTRQYPIQVQTVKGQVAAEITVTGGQGYVPLTFTGVDSYSGYRLEIKKDGVWQKVDQSVQENDYWQTLYDAQRGTYELSFNVPHTDPLASYNYRLVKGSD